MASDGRWPDVDSGGSAPSAQHPETQVTRLGDITKTGIEASTDGDRSA